MKVTRLRIGLVGPKDPRDDENNYYAEAIEGGERFFYRANGFTFEITADQHRKVIGNPRLHYFSTALKLHFRIKRAKRSFVMSFLKPGTLCITVGATLGENAGRVVEVTAGPGGDEKQQQAGEYWYLVRSVSGRSFGFLRATAGPTVWYCCGTDTLLAERRNLRLLVDPKVEAEERTPR